MKQPESTLEILRATRELFREYGWTKYHLAVDANGDPVDPTSPAARCFCLSGAMRRVCDLNHGVFYEAMDRLSWMVPQKSVTVWNDACSDKAEVEALLDFAIKEVAA